MVASSQSYASAKRPVPAAQAIYFQDGALLTGLLTAALYLILAVTLAVSHHTASLPLFMLVAVSAWFLGLLMAYSRFDGYFAFSYSILAGLPWLFILSACLNDDKGAAIPIDKMLGLTSHHFQTVLFALLKGLADAQNLDFDDNPYTFIFAVCLLLWWLTYFGVWTILRYGATWRMVIPASAVMIVSVINSPGASPHWLLPPFLLVVFALLVHTNLAEQQWRWRVHKIYFQPTIARSFWRDGLLYGLTVFAIAWLIPGLGQWSHWSWDMLPLPGLSSRLAASATFPNELNLGGPRHVDDDPLFTVVTTGGSGNHYWRAVVYDTFNGHGWLNTANHIQPIDGNLPIPTESVQGRTLLIQRITLMDVLGNSIMGAPDIVQVSVPVTAAVRSTAGQSSELMMLQSRQALRAGESYTVISQVADVTEQGLREAGVAYPAALLPTYTQLPDAFSPRIVDIARRLTAGQATVYDKVKAVERYLRTFSYNENIQAPPANLDPVEYFLFDIQQGYCDYYATAMAVMLRSLQIPVRVVSGYATGQFDPASGRYTVSAQDAHTWVEVYFPRYGWIEFEPTASKSEMNQSLASPSPVSPLATPSASKREFQPPATSHLPETRIGFKEKPLFGLSQAGFANRRSWLWASLSLLLLLLGLLIWRRWRRERSLTFTHDLPSVLYGQMGQGFARLGLRTRTSDTPYEQARRFARRLPAGRPLIRRITEAYVRYRFSRPANAIDGTANTSPAIVSDTGDAWRQLQRLLWRAWLRKCVEKLWWHKTMPLPLRER